MNKYWCERQKCNDLQGGGDDVFNHSSVMEGGGTALAASRDSVPDNGNEKRNGE